MGRFIKTLTWIIFFLRGMNVLSLSCNVGEYEINNECCAFCPAGTVVRNHCTRHTSTECIKCISPTYMDHPNGYTKCLRCKICDRGAGLVTKKPCTSISNTVCECQKGFFCPEGDGKECDLCQKYQEDKPQEQIQTLELKLSGIAETNNHRTMSSSKNLSRFWEWGRKIICVGRNYAEHAKELKNAVPAEPVLFLKPPSAYVREGSPVLVPYYSNNLHHEVELGVVIGKPGKDIAESSAMEHVEGYALCLDMTARDTQDQCKKKGLPWTLAKAFDTSCPVSDLIPKERIQDPHNVNIWLKVNDSLRQEGNTSSMIFSVPFLISYISKIITLEEGDLILTGTPKGVAAVQENDVMLAGIDDVISMKFKVKRQS